MNILRNYIYWFLTFILICLIGISNVFALENGGAIRFYDNNGSSLTYVTTDYIQQTDESSAIFTTTSNSYGGGLMLQLPTPLIQNHIYTLFVNVAAANMGGFTKPSTKNCIGVGNGYTDTINSYINCSITPKYTQESGVTADKRNGLYFTFIANTNASYVLIAYTSDNTCTNCLQYSYGYNITDGGDTSGLSQTQVNNIINQQTTTIQNDIYNMQQAVAGSIDDLSETLTENQKVCYDTGINDIDINNKALNTSGDEFNNNSFGISKYFTINSDTKIEVLNTTTSTTGYCFYSANKGKLGCYNESSLTQEQILTIPTNAKYFRFSINKDSKRPQFRICKNGNQATNDTLNELNDSINNDDVDNSDYGSFFSNFNTDTFGLTSIITAPLNLIQSLSSSTCNDLELPLPYLTNKKLTLPCMTTIYSQYFGTFFTIYQTITFGIVAYWVCVRIFNQVKDFKNPEHDEIEVFDL